MLVRAFSSVYSSWTRLALDDDQPAAGWRLARPVLRAPRAYAISNGSVPSSAVSTSTENPRGISHSAALQRLADVVLQALAEGRLHRECGGPHPRTPASP